MDGNPIYLAFRHSRAALLGAALFVTVPAAAPALAEAGASEVGDSFAAGFANFDRPTRKFEPAPHAVDLSTIDVPIEPELPAARALGSGVASYYGRRFAGRPTASGERFDPGQLTAAHRTLPFGSKVRVTNRHNGQSVVVRINDRGPFVRGRTIDLSRAAAEHIGLIRRGHGTVELELLED